MNAGNKIDVAQQERNVGGSIIRVNVPARQKI